MEPLQSPYNTPTEAKNKKQELIKIYDVGYSPSAESDNDGASKTASEK